MCPNVAVLMLVAAAGIAGTTAAQPCEPHWSDQFPAADLSIVPWDLTVFDDGAGGGPAVYATGLVLSGGSTLYYIARLGNTGWEPLGDGLDEGAMGLTVFNDALFVGGSFESAGGVIANGVARWDGRAWSALGDGISGDVTWAAAFAEFDDGSGDQPALYVGGFFTGAGAVSANNIAKWDGAEWSPLGEGLNHSVGAIAVFDDGDGPDLYVGGFFTSAGGVTADRIARWDGNSWSAVGSGMVGGLDGVVKALVVFDDGLGGGPSLYAGGTFAALGGVVVNYLARWDGRTWTPLAGGVNGEIGALAVFDDGSGPALYAAGAFTEAGGIDAVGAAKWDGVTWTPLGVGADESITSLVPFENAIGGAKLYAGGFFHSAGGLLTERCAAWDGTQWSAVGSGIRGSVRALLDMDQAGEGPVLYAGGSFHTAGGIFARNIVGWDGRSWTTLGDGLEGEFIHGKGPFERVEALASYDDGGGRGSMLYVGGQFIKAGGVKADNIAAWDGTTWSALGAGVEGTILALAVVEDGAAAAPGLYAGGSLTEAGGIPVSNVARWDGTSWSPLGAGTDDDVRALAFFDDGFTGGALYAAGDFANAGGVTASGIARWDGVSWSALDSGIKLVGNYRVSALAVYDDGRGEALYAGGYFYVAGGITVSGLGRWDGYSWSAVGGGVSFPFVQSLTVFDDGFDARSALYAGGQFDLAGGLIAASVARWNGAYWSQLAEGITGEYSSVAAMTAFDDSSADGPALFVGGEFEYAGGESSPNFAKWVGCPIDDPPPFGPCRYEVTIIQGPGDTTFISGLNENGTLIGKFGTVAPPTSFTPFTWTAESGFVELVFPPNGGQAMTDFNDGGQIVGYLDPGGGYRAYLHDEGQVVLLPIPAEATKSRAFAINNSELIAGRWGNVNTGSVHTALLWQDGAIVDPQLPLGPLSVALDVNEGGQVVGWMGGTHDSHAFIWDDGVVTDLGVIPGGVSSQALGINNTGLVVGRGEIPKEGFTFGVSRGFVLDNGSMTVIEPLAGFLTTQAVDVNDSGVVVGWSSDTDDNPWEKSPFVWHEGELTDLNEVIAWDLGLHLESIVAINNAGQIALSAESPTGTVGVLLTPITPPVGDINGNCRIDTDDLMILLYEWGQSDSPADLNGDGTVGIVDFLILLANWG